MTLRIPADRGDLIALLHSDAVLQQSRHDETDGALLAKALGPVVNSP